MVLLPQEMGGNRAIDGEEVVTEVAGPVTGSGSAGLTRGARWISGSESSSGLRRRIPRFVAINRIGRTSRSGLQRTARTVCRRIRTMKKLGSTERTAHLKMRCGSQQTHDFNA